MLGTLRWGLGAHVRLCIAYPRRQDGVVRRRYGWKCVIRNGKLSALYRTGGRDILEDANACDSEVALGAQNDSQGEDLGGRCGLQHVLGRRWIRPCG